MLLNLQMGMQEPWKASAPEVYLLRTTDGSVPRGLDPNRRDGSTCCFSASFPASPSSCRGARRGRGTASGAPPPATPCAPSAAGNSSPARRARRSSGGVTASRHYLEGVDTTRSGISELIYCIIGITPFTYDT